MNLFDSQDVIWSLQMLFTSYVGFSVLGFTGFTKQKISEEQKH